MEQFEEVGRTFAQYYYGVMSENQREQIVNLYTDDSCLTFEGVKCLGKASIVEKLKSLSFKKVAYAITTLDCQPVAGMEAITVSVMGQMKSDDDPAQSFCQFFLLKKCGANYVVSNDTFRLVLHNTVAN